VDLAAGSVYQDAREVKTKFSKSFTTYFFPVGDDMREIVEAWVRYLREVRLWGNEDPLFPATQVEVGPARHFQAVGVERKPWASAAAIRTIFKEAFTAAGLPYFNPHSLRSTLVQLGEKTCKTPEQFKAWSQNLGHEGVLTTFYSYGTVQPQRQGEIIKELARPRPQAPATSADDFAAAVARAMIAQGSRLASA
jgi:integrase